MKVKKLLATLMLCIGCSFMFFGCIAENPHFTPEGKTPYPYDDDFISGYFLTFRDENPDWISSSSNDFESSNAVKYYASIKYSSSQNSKGLLFVENGLNINTGSMHLEGDPLQLDKSGSITLHDKIYFTTEMYDKNCILSTVMYNAAERRSYTQEYTKDLSQADLQLCGARK